MNHVYRLIHATNPIVIINNSAVVNISFNGSANAITFWIAPVIIPIPRATHTSAPSTIFISICFNITYLFYLNTIFNTINQNNTTQGTAQSTLKNTFVNNHNLYFSYYGVNIRTPLRGAKFILKSFCNGSDSIEHNHHIGYRRF